LAHAREAAAQEIEALQREVFGEGQQSLLVVARDDGAVRGEQEGRIVVGRRRGSHLAWAAGHQLDARRQDDARYRLPIEWFLVEEKRHGALRPEDDQGLVLAERLIGETEVDLQVLTVELGAPLRAQIEIALHDRD